jgi:hypothetical protein
MENNTFILATDGWVQVTPCGEFPHVGAGVTQVIDREACDRIAAEFNSRKADSNFPGVLVDFDHFSLDTGQSSEAAGWITELESRDTGLWARVRWSDAGLAAVQGGRFRLMSPVFPPPSQCEDLGGGRIRPRALGSVALTNEPNIKGGRPLANRQPVENRSAAKRKLMWVLGNPPSGKHCDTCLARAGKIKTAVEWARMKPPPCNCHCTLEPVDDATANRWSDMARAASLAVRRAKSAQRKAQERLRDGTAGADGSRKDAKAQRAATAREAVLRELAERRKKRQSSFAKATEDKRPTLK